MPSVTTTRKGTKFLIDEVWYLPTFLIDNKHAGATGECSLFVRRFRLREAPSGRRRIEVTGDVLSFENEDEMTAAITEHGLQELPAEAEAGPLYLPPRFRNYKHVTVGRGYGRIRLT